VAELVRDAFVDDNLLFAEAIRRRDALAACTVYADDARLLPPSAAELIGPNQIRAFWEAGLNSGITDLDFQPIEVRSDDVIACESGRYTLRLEPADGPHVIERGHYVHVHSRQPDGSWRRDVEIFTPGGAE
jgi:ketosteroid isomerase-like protein